MRRLNGRGQQLKRLEEGKEGLEPSRWWECRSYPRLGVISSHFNANATFLVGQHFPFNKLTGHTYKTGWDAINDYIVLSPRLLYFSTMSSMSWKDSNCHKRILREAEAGRYGVIAAIAYNIEQILGLVRAAETARSPLIIQFFPWAIEATDGMLVRAAADAAKRSNVPISIHLDHAQSEDIIKRAADLPFDSIMVDMSHYEKEINLRMSRELVQYCNEREKVTEAEPGRIEGGEDGVMDTAGLEACMTTAEEVDEFFATGVDVLAPSFGNVHGEYGLRGPQLDFER